MEFALVFLMGLNREHEGMQDDRKMKVRDPIDVSISNGILLSASLAYYAKNKNGGYGRMHARTY